MSINLIKEAVYKLCYRANTCLDNSVYCKIKNAFENCTNEETKNLLKCILQNAKIACEKERPLCQDTGQVIVFLELGQNICIKDGFIEDAVNDAVGSCYKDCCFRKSVVNNAVFDRTNTKTNTPVVIYTKLIKEDEIRIKVLIKGAGSENKSYLEMLLPTASEHDIIEKITSIVLSAGENACPPMFIGIGIGYTAEKAMLMSKEALVTKSFEAKETVLADKIRNNINDKASGKYKNCFVLDVKLLSGPTHIACLPLAVTINCHSDRFSSCIIKNNEILYHHNKPEFIDFDCNNTDKKEIFADDIDAIKNLNQGDEFLLSGEIYVARDMAHKRLIDLINTREPLPITIQDKIIFYAGPCPNKIGEVSGSIGPTTAGRMDKYADTLYKMGLLASIGKGSRNIDIEKTIRKTGSKYFTMQGGIAALLADKILKSDIIAFEDLGAEALYKITVDKFPLKVEIA